MDLTSKSMDTSTDLRSTDKRLLGATLLALFDLARANVPASVERLGGRLGASDDRIRRALARLERDGLADAERVRLSLLGLAIATRLLEAREASVAFAA